MVTSGMAALRNAYFQISTPLRRAQGAGDPDVVAVQHVEHGRADDAGLRGDRIPAERDGRHDQMRGRTVPEGGQPVQVNGEDQDQQQADPEVRHRLAEHGETFAEAVEP